MSATSYEFDVEETAAGHHWPRSNRKAAYVHAWLIVHSIDTVHGVSLKESVINHCFSTTKTFFCRLKNKVNTAVKISRFRKILGCTEQHRGMTIVTARMHFSIYVGAMIKLVGLVYR